MIPLAIKRTRNWEELSRLRSDIVSFVEERSGLIDSLKLDIEFCMPDGNWHCNSNNDYLTRYAQLRDCPIEDVSNRIHDLSASHRGAWPEDVYSTYVRVLLFLGFQVQKGLTLLEIGAGHGGLAYELLQVLGTSTKYIICDIPESLLFSGLNLVLAGYKVRLFDRLLPIEDGVTLVPNYFFGNLKGQKIDLALNTLSMSEMSAYQVEVYSSGISRLIGDTGAFFEVNHDNSVNQWGPAVGHGLNAKFIIEKYFNSHLNSPWKNIADIWYNN